MTMDRFYTYVYLDPRKSGRFEYDSGRVCFDFEPFYVGIGSNGRRHRDHLNEVKRLMAKGITNKEIRNSGGNFHKIFKIKKMINEGYEPIIIKVLTKVGKQIAIDHEIDLVAKIGRVGNKTGPLVNMTGGGEGMRDVSDELSARLGKIQRRRFEDPAEREKSRVGSLGNTNASGKRSSDICDDFSKITQDYYATERGKKIIEQIKETLRGTKHTEEEKRKMRLKKAIYYANVTEEEKSTKANKGWLTRRRMQFLNVLVQISHQKNN